MCNYGDVTTIKQAKVFCGPRTDWAEVVQYTDSEHYHLRYMMADDGSTMQTYMKPEKIAELLEERNGLYEEVRDGDKLSIHRNGVLIQEGLTLPGGTTHSKYDLAVCAVLGELLGDEFSGYEHNYRIINNLVTDE